MKESLSIRINVDMKAFAWAVLVFGAKLYADMRRN